MKMDPIGTRRDTAYDPADPWPILWIEAGIWECAGSAPGQWWRVDVRGRVPACRCRRDGWRGGICWHAREVQRQAPAIEAEWAAAPKRAA